MGSRREWVPAVNWGSPVNIGAGTTTQFVVWGEDELYVPYAADEATFLRLKGHFSINGVSVAAGPIGWRVRIGLDDLQIGGALATAGDLDDGEVAEEHFLDERFWVYNGTAQPESNDHPYWFTFDTGSKRKLQSPMGLVISAFNGTAQDLSWTPFVRGLFLFA